MTGKKVLDGSLPKACQMAAVRLPRVHVTIFLRDIVDKVYTGLLNYRLIYAGKREVTAEIVIAPRLNQDLNPTSGFNYLYFLIKIIIIIIYKKG